VFPDFIWKISAKGAPHYRRPSCFGAQSSCPFEHARRRIVYGRAVSDPPRTLARRLPAGGSNDLVARILSEWLSARLGQRVIVENRLGDSNNIATAAVIGSPPDGNTLYFVNAALYTKFPFDLLRDMAPVVAIMRLPNVLDVHPSVPAKTIPELIAYAKANPAKLNMASSGVGLDPFDRRAIQDHGGH
jgi:tripartite-type tricarboxylate transporter receptor subunit TctC